MRWRPSAVWVNVRADFARPDAAMTRSALENQATRLAPLRPGVVDLQHSTDPARELHSALSAHGFVAIRNTPVNDHLRQQAFTSAREFFSRELDEKNVFAYQDTQQNFGYQGLKSEALDPTIAGDLKEAFTMRSLSKRAQHAENPAENHNPNAPESAPGATDWLDTDFGQTDFGQIAQAMYQACCTSALAVLTLLENALNCAEGTFTAHHTGENMTLRYLHYPTVDNSALSAAQPGLAKKKSQLGAGAHTDYGTITLLFSDGVAGLQLFDPHGTDPTQTAADQLSVPPEQTNEKSNNNVQGRWRDVEVAPGDVLVNTGDLMAVWSNGIYPSTLHRVLPRLEDPPRYSMAFFVDPDSRTRIGPLPSCISKTRPARTKTVTAGEHIQARIDASQRTLAATRASSGNSGAT